MQPTDHLTDEQLNEYLDEAAPDRAGLEQHLSACAECAARLADLGALFREIESLPEVTLRRDLAASVKGSLNAVPILPRWLTLTAALQAGAALVTAFAAAPIAIQLISASLPRLQPPSFTAALLQLEVQWRAWLDMLSQVHLPGPPQLPGLEVSSLFLVPGMAGISILWLVGNGLLLRNQIK